MSPATTRKIREKLRRLDVVFAIDTTGSMGPSIAEVKKRLIGFAHALAQAEVRPSVALGVVAYRDHPPEDSTYVTQVYPLTEKVEVCQRNINSLTAFGGGDGPEAVLDGLHDALNAIEWREYAHKVVLLVGDAPPHGMVGSEGTASSKGKPEELNLLERALRSLTPVADRWPAGCPSGLTSAGIVAHAQGMGITVHAVGVGSDVAMARSFKQIAAATGGEFVSLEKIDTLIDRILDLLRTELGKVAVDIDVFGAWAEATDKSAQGLAVTLGREAAEVDESMKRLASKGALAVDDATAESFRVMLGETSARGAALIPTVEIDAELLGQIKILEDLEGVDTSEGSFEIRILDE
ncbi:MAG TPA: vWA domain-containing protein [Anaerolineae bacterium]|nr:vWA domain-containing protein [Anaerolineae bacterium]